MNTKTRLPYPTVCEILSYAEQGLTAYAISKKIRVHLDTVRKVIANPERYIAENTVPNITITAPVLQEVDFDTLYNETPEVDQPYGIHNGIILVLNDIHFPHQDNKAISAAVFYAKKHFQITHVLFNGDILDMYQTSRFDKNPNRASIRREFEVCYEFLNKMRELFPTQQFIWKNGNHEERWNHYLWKHGKAIWDMEQLRLENILKFADLNIIKLSDKQLVNVNGLYIGHGHEYNRGGEMAARNRLMHTMENTMVGHLHFTDTKIIPRAHSHEELVSYNVGALCHLKPLYNSVNKHNHGFAVVEAYNKTFAAHNYRIKNDYSVI